MLRGNEKEEIRERELKKGFITYETLADYVGDMVMCNNIGEDYEHNELENGTEYEFFDEEWEEITENEYNELERQNKECHTANKDFFQYFIITEMGADFLKFHTNEVVYYNTVLDVYIWAVDHCGTSWKYVFTDIEIEKENK